MSKLGTLKSGASKRKYYIILIAVIGFMFIYFTDAGFKTSIDNMFSGVLTQITNMATGAFSIITSSGPWQTYIEPRRDLAIGIGGAAAGILAMRYGAKIISGTKSATSTVRESASKLSLPKLGGVASKEVTELKTQVASYGDILARMEAKMAQLTTPVNPAPSNPGTLPPKETTT